LLRERSLSQAIVFVNSKLGAARLARSFERDGMRTAALHGDKSQDERLKSLAAFKAGEVDLLVATDVAARGLDIADLPAVFNFDVPFNAEDYVHRIGRTARLGAEGDAISFACEIYAQSLPDIEAYIEQKLPVESVTAELLTALPRPPRAAPQPGDEVDEDAGESIGTIFKEAREQRIADEQRRGGGRSGSGSGRSGGPSRPRSGAPSGDGKPRAPRPPRSAEAAPAKPVVGANPVAAAASGASAPSADPTRPPRKRRRRRHGVPVDGAVANSVSAQTQTATAPKPVAPADNSSFLTKLGRKLKSLVSGA
jgi:ATP-dependent RNA helicase RhlB